MIWNSEDENEMIIIEYDYVLENTWNWMNRKYDRNAFEYANDMKFD